MTVHPRLFEASEVAELCAELRRESHTEAVSIIVARLLDMGVTEELALWAASESKGTDLEDRFLDALNRVYS